jgi:hypothetical protein
MVGGSPTALLHKRVETARLSRDEKSQAIHFRLTCYRFTPSSSARIRFGPPPACPGGGRGYKVRVIHIGQEPIMSRAFLPLSVALLLGTNPGPGGAAEDKKTDLESAAPAGKEVTLTRDEVVPSDQPNADGFHTAQVKPGKAGPKVKMPAQAYGLNFYAEPVKGGLKVAELPEGSALQMLRTAPKKDGGGVPGAAEVGDVITHADGHAVSSVEELVVALSTAKDKDDVQLVMKDQNTGNAIVVYVTAVKK